MNNLKNGSSCILCFIYETTLDKIIVLFFFFNKTRKELGLKIANDTLQNYDFTLRSLPK